MKEVLSYTARFRSDVMSQSRTSDHGLNYYYELTVILVANLIGSKIQLRDIHQSGSLRYFLEGLTEKGTPSPRWRWQRQRQRCAVTCLPLPFCWCVHLLGCCFCCCYCCHHLLFISIGTQHYVGSREERTYSLKLPPMCTVVQVPPHTYT